MLGIQHKYQNVCQDVLGVIAKRNNLCGNAGTRSSAQRGLPNPYLIWPIQKKLLTCKAWAGGTVNVLDMCVRNIDDR